jgi:hypothetical protein
VLRLAGCAHDRPAGTLLACDFGVTVTATFRVLHLFVILEVGSRRLVHVNVINHPTAAWTLQQFRDVLGTPRRRGIRISS